MSKRVLSNLWKVLVYISSLKNRRVVPVRNTGKAVSPQSGGSVMPSMMHIGVLIP